MLNILRKSNLQLPRVALTPLRSLLGQTQKHRQANALRKLDARALKDIGMTEARRDQELRNLAKL